MKTYVTTARAEGGSALLVGVLATALIGGLLGVYLTLVRSQNATIARSQAWNSTVPILEAGLEDALAHLAANGITNLASDGWAYLNGYYVMQRNVGDGFYIAGINTSNSLMPVVISQAYVELNQLASAPVSSSYLLASAGPSLNNGYLGRGVRVTTFSANLFAKGLVAKGQINLNGNNVETDSFDSSDPNHSTNGQYDPTKRKDRGDVATNSELINSVNVGGANIYGTVSTGPGGTVQIGSNGSVGDAAWHAGGNTGIQPGHSTDDMNVSFPDMEAPYTGGAWTPGGGWIDGVSYAYVLGSGNYQLPFLSMNSNDKMIVTGNAVLYVTGNASLSGNASIIVATNASLAMYVGGVSASLGGSGVINQAASATNFVYYGLPSNTSLSISGNGEFKGILYAPSAAFSMNGSGSGFNDFIGSSVTGSVVMNGHFRFHYDEILAQYGPQRGYIVTSWNELPPTAFATLEALVGQNVH